MGPTSPPQKPLVGTPSGLSQKPLFGDPHGARPVSPPPILEVPCGAQGCLVQSRPFLGTPPLSMGLTLSTQRSVCSGPPRGSPLPPSSLSLQPLPPQLSLSPSHLCPPPPLLAVSPPCPAPPAAARPAPPPPPAMGAMGARELHRGVRGDLGTGGVVVGYGDPASPCLSFPIGIARSLSCCSAPPKSSPTGLHGGGEGVPALFWGGTFHHLLGTGSWGGCGAPWG